MDIVCKHSPHKLLRSCPPQYYIELECLTLANVFNSVSISKITRIHKLVSNALALSSLSYFPIRQFSGISVFKPVSSEEVLELIRSLPDKSSPLDNLPTPPFNKYTLVLSQIFSKLTNLTFQLSDIINTYGRGNCAVVIDTTSAFAVLCILISLLSVWTVQFHLLWHICLFNTFI